MCSTFNNASRASDRYEPDGGERLGEGLEVAKVLRSGKAECGTPLGAGARAIVVHHVISTSSTQATPRQNSFDNEIIIDIRQGQITTPKTAG